MPISGISPTTSPAATTNPADKPELPPSRQKIAPQNDREERVREPTSQEQVLISQADPTTDTKSRGPDSDQGAIGRVIDTEA
jgi:hypothetical protein